MNLGIDARLLFNTTGIGRYTRSLFFEFLRQAPAHDAITLFYDGDFEAECQHYASKYGEILPTLPSHVRLVTARCPRRIVWTNWHLPSLLRQHDIDVYHGVCNFELPLRKVCRYVVTIHDLVPLFFPHLVPKKHLLFFKLFMKHAAHGADVVITDSEHSRQDIIKHLGVAEKKIRVIYLGYNPRYRNISDAAAIHHVLDRHNIRPPYLLFVGVIEPKKNLERLFEALVILRDHHAEADNLSLVVAGGKGWFYEQVFQKVQTLGLEKIVHFTGFFPDEDLPALYNGAEAFVFPSIYEGFGLPVLEAMACGTPVVTANVSSLPEIAGEAGVLVHPDSAESIAEGIAEAVFDAQKNAQMRRHGLRRASQFSWRRTATETYAVYQEAFK